MKNSETASCFTILVLALLLFPSCNEKCFTPVLVPGLIFTDENQVPIITEHNKSGLKLNLVVETGETNIDENLVWKTYTDHKLDKEFLYLDLTEMGWNSASQGIKEYKIIWIDKEYLFIIDVEEKKKKNCIYFNNNEISVDHVILKEHPEYLGNVYFKI